MVTAKRPARRNGRARKEKAALKTILFPDEVKGKLQKMTQEVDSAEMMVHTATSKRAAYLEGYLDSEKIDPTKYRITVDGMVPLPANEESPE